MATPSARYEFRCFAPDFGASRLELSRSLKLDSIRETAETYLVWPELAGWNVKYRAGRLELKALRRREQRLEQWQPVAVEDLSARRESLPPTLERVLRTARHVRGGAYPPGVVEAVVLKDRRSYSGREFGAEWVRLAVNGGAVQSLAVESDEPAAVLAAIRQLRIAGFENLSYPAALKRMVGLAPLPSADARWLCGWEYANG